MPRDTDNPFKAEYFHDNATPLDFDEAQAVLDAPPENAPLDEELVPVFEGDIEHGDFKIEVYFGSRRTDGHIVTKTVMWLSGRQMSGDGDESIFICGYPDCSRPIMPQFIQGNWSVCPTCASEKRNNGGIQVSSSAEAHGYRVDKSGTKLIPGMKYRQFRKNQVNYPSIRDSIWYAGPPTLLADILAQYWHFLEGKADLYFKYSPNDIRAQDAAKIDFSVDDPESQFAIYKMSNIVKDTLGGSTLAKRILVFIRA